MMHFLTLVYDSYQYLTNNLLISIRNPCFTTFEVHHPPMVQRTTFGQVNIMPFLFINKGEKFSMMPNE